MKFGLSYKQYVCLFSNIMFRIIQSTQNVLSIQNILYSSRYVNLPHLNYSYNLLSDSDL